MRPSVSERSTAMDWCSSDMVMFEKTWTNTKKERLSYLMYDATRTPCVSLETLCETSNT